VSCNVYRYPLDTIKTRMQAAGPGSTRGLASTALGILRHEGVQGLYRGMTAAAVGAGPAHALYYAGARPYLRLLCLCKACLTLGHREPIKVCCGPSSAAYEWLKGELGANRKGHQPAAVATAGAAALDPSPGQCHGSMVLVLSCAACDSLLGCTQQVSSPQCSMMQCSRQPTS
jgi:hypothetical protein